MDKKRIAIGSLIAAALVVSISIVPANHVICLIVLLGVCAAASWEFYGLLAIGGIKSSKKWGTVCGLIFSAATWRYMEHNSSLVSDSMMPPPDTMLWSVMCVLLISILLRILVCHDMREGLYSALGTLLGFLYVPFLWSFFIRVFLSGDLDEPAWAGFYLLLCMKLADSGGYFIGTQFGKTRLAPVISPKKSWEGLIGSIVFCLAANLLWVLFSRGRIGAFHFHFGHAAILGILIPIVGTTGDLVESMLKRAVGIKDSNTVVYGLGGILDMIDSLLFVSPLFYIFMQFVLSPL